VVDDDPGIDAVATRAIVTWTTSVRMTLRNPPVVAYSVVNETMQPIEKRLAALRNQMSADATSAVRGVSR
jgi:hypothetical protein